MKNDKGLASYGKLWIANLDMVQRLKDTLSLNKYDTIVFYQISALGYFNYSAFEEALKLGYDKS